MSNTIPHFTAGMVVGAVVLIVIWLLALPSIYQISWGLAGALVTWLYLDDRGVFGETNE